MVDGLIYYDEMLSLLKEKMGVEEEDDLEAISLKSYKNVPPAKKKEYKNGITNKIAPSVNRM